MSRYSRINTIWRKELIDILRDRRTIFAMVLVPIILYPALMLGSLQALEAQHSQFLADRYEVIVPSEAAGKWLRRVLDTDAVRRPLSEEEAAAAPSEDDSPLEVARAAQTRPAEAEPPLRRDAPAMEEARGARGAAGPRTAVRGAPPEYRITVRAAYPHEQFIGLRTALREGLRGGMSDAGADAAAGRLASTIWRDAWIADFAGPLLAGTVHVGVIVEGDAGALSNGGNVAVRVIMDQTEIRSSIATEGLLGVLERMNERLVEARMRRANIERSYLHPLHVESLSVATPEKVGGSVLGQIVPLILIIMTITGAIYPAIDLTAGERERGTLETLMVAPVATVELIAGKFIVVTMVSLISAGLNLASIGGTIWLGGLGKLLTRGQEVVIPLTALPWVLLALVPLAVMFGAVLLAVCSFARSFKEAQNYVMPVMVAAMIPAVVGILPGTRLEGPLLVMPVANIVVLTRELFVGRFDPTAIVWVIASTSLYAGAAVAVAAKLFGQEAVLFADSGSVRTIFQRRYFTPRRVPTAASAMLVLGLVFPLNFFIQRALGESPLFHERVEYLYALWAVFLLLFVGVPVFAAKYMRVTERTALRVGGASLPAWGAALCLGLSTWALAPAWLAYQQTFLPMPPDQLHALEVATAWLKEVPLWLIVLVLAVTAGVCEEVFFRGYVLSGLRPAIGPVAAIVVVALAFGVYHNSAHRLILTSALGIVLGLLALRSGSIWPSVLVHVLHNGLTLVASRADGMGPWLEQSGWTDAEGMPAPGLLMAAGALLVIGLGLCLMLREPVRAGEGRAAAAAGVGSASPA
ncbi:MAG: CPBP family intramembrane metalloprotease [Phycisphaerales bacterium]|nr:CPBP family intramembrane metalloprotease [Phycisphaerales bacterium]